MPKLGVKIKSPEGDTLLKEHYRPATSIYVLRQQLSSRLHVRPRFVVRAAARCGCGPRR